MTGLFNKIGRNNWLMMQPTEEELKYHCCGHPDHRTFFIESEGSIQAFNNYYPLKIIRGENILRYVIIEFLISENSNKDHIIALLQETLNFAEEIGSKGVVIENATYLEQDAYRQLGLMPTFRKMIMTMISKEEINNYYGDFKCDVK